MSLECNQGANRHVELAQLLGTAKVGQVDDEAGCQHLSAQFAQELDRPLRRSAGGDQVIHQDHTIAGRQCVLVHFHFIEAIFQRIGDRNALVR